MLRTCRRGLIAAVLFAAGAASSLAQAPAPAPAADDGSGIIGPGLGIGTRRDGIDSLTGAGPVLPTPRADAGANTRRGAFQELGRDGDSLLPYTSSGYVGVSLGRPDYSLGCGAGGRPCDNPDGALRLYTGGMFTPHLGLELAWLDLGRADRGGGTAQARGFDVSLVGRVRLGESFAAYGRLGTTWGRTRLGVDAASGLVGGEASGWGLSYGAGLSLDMTPHWSALLEWTQHDFRFPGDTTEPVSATSVGLLYRF
jgi:OmpA-OmpF porin, OOP family